MGGDQNFWGWGGTGLDGGGTRVPWGRVPPHPPPPRKTLVTVVFFLSFLWGGGGLLFVL